MNREDFEILNSDVIYFDNAATTFKPNCVVDSVVDYYTKYTSNAHRGDYDNSFKVDTLYEGVRGKVRNLISCCKDEEIVFTSGTTEGLNMVVFGFMKYVLKAGDEVILSKAEHASNILPWIELSHEIGIKIKYVSLNEDLSINYDSLCNMINSNTKVISIAHITNTVGDIRDLERIGELCLENNIYFVVDGAQGVPHRKIDVVKNNISFLAASAHKMMGPTGVGFLYGKYELLDKMKPLCYGGGMNNTFEGDGFVEYKSVPTRFEAGTQNIAGVIGMGSAIDYLLEVGYENIEKTELELRNYLIEKLESVKNINIYNKNSNSSIVLFNLEGVFAQDTALFLNHYHICVRAGNHCAKIIKKTTGVTNSIRISLYFYNTESEIDELVELLSNKDKILKEML